MFTTSGSTGQIKIEPNTIDLATEMALTNTVRASWVSGAVGMEARLKLLYDRIS